MYSEDYNGAYAQERNGEDVYSKPVKAGKRTYFFDVKATKGNDYYLTITESKRKIGVTEVMCMTSTRFSSTKKTSTSSSRDLRKFLTI